MSDNERTANRSERRERGKALRKEVSRSSHGTWVPAPDRPDPISLLRDQDRGRLEHLLPIKYGRMLESPFSFLRGSATVMAADLASTPVTGLQVQLCGDAHLLNFGVFATPERKLVFDINDFDETYAGPWEWDLKRLAASAVVAGRENEFGEDVNRKLAETVTSSYRDAMLRLSLAPTLDVWYFNVDVDRVLEAFERSSGKARKGARKMVRKARTHTHEQTLEMLTELVDGRRRILNDPPLLVRLSELLTEEQKAQLTEQDIEKMWLEYLSSLPEERRLLLSRFRVSGVALRVGGIGSVGTLCLIVLLEGGAKDDALILQLKEAGPSVLEPYVKKRDYGNHARRVVLGQRLMQAASDIFLGWHKGLLTGIQFYWRQLKDMKGSMDVAALDEAGLETYLKVCSVCLARAHARTGDASAISGYIGKGDAFARAIADFAVAYADQTERDYQTLVEAVESGKIAAEKGI
ncbi:DUF2252 domain-containing protein [Methanosarcina sp. KYL-1]|uniref:DUF2252 domain-containing protein n=1 Tax=Methanosarcina sp. KYL-1 TaxID=2602068 RepID=UPI002100BF6E|nr:DUF2252 domain-containing protein [Methanosarcina sp. KYL-1]MCQ1535544.1 DUF2252 domain-containing protein [Methanosarcina sp. KYL-1]